MSFLWRVRVFLAKNAKSGRVPLELGLQNNSVNTPWGQRAKTLESFYDSAKTW
jgi:antitoxin component of RelBE/YafQ-DinJ toxin-antitoxin module